MKRSINLIVTLMSVVTILSFASCTNEDVELSTGTRSAELVSVDFVAHFTPQQEAALLEQATRSETKNKRIPGIAK